MKLILIIAAVFLTGCSTLMCAGTGTCVDGTMSYKTPQQRGQFTPQTLQFNGQTITIIPEYSSQRTQAILVNGK